MPPATSVVRSRMSLHSPSISWRSDSRHAFSCGESTSTPSTSKIAPWNIATRPPISRGLLALSAGVAGGQPEHAPVAGA